MDSINGSFTKVTANSNMLRAHQREAMTFDCDVSGSFTIDSNETSFSLTYNSCVDEEGTSVNGSLTISSTQTGMTMSGNMTVSDGSETVELSSLSVSFFSVENGFAYDYDFSATISSEDFTGTISMDTIEPITFDFGDGETLSISITGKYRVTANGSFVEVTYLGDSVSININGETTVTHTFEEFGEF